MHKQKVVVKLVTVAKRKIFLLRVALENNDGPEKFKEVYLEMIGDIVRKMTVEQA